MHQKKSLTASSHSKFTLTYCYIVEWNRILSLFLKTTTSSLRRRNIAFVIAHFHIPKLQKSPTANNDKTLTCLLFKITSYKKKKYKSPPD